MTRRTLNEELQAIESVIAEQAGGIGISALEHRLAQRLSAVPNRRTLQRRLDRLIQAGRIISKGESVALVYQLSPQSAVVKVAGVTATASVGAAQAELYVPVSPEGRKPQFVAPHTKSR